MAAHNISLLLKEVCRPAEQLLLDAGQRASHLYEDLTQCLFAAPQAYIQRESLYCMSKRYHIHRLYVGGAKSSTDYSFIGWVLTSDVSQCMICNVDFSNDSSKHHCMACGNVVCPNCSPSQAEILEIQELGPQRVCTQCYFGQEVVEGQWSLRQQDDLYCDELIKEIRHVILTTSTSAMYQRQPLLPNRTVPVVVKPTPRSLDHLNTVVTTFDFILHPTSLMALCDENAAVQDAKLHKFCERMMKAVNIKSRCSGTHQFTTLDSGSSNSCLLETDLTTTATSSTVHSPYSTNGPDSAAGGSTSAGRAALPWVLSRTSMWSVQARPGLVLQTTAHPWGDTTYKSTVYINLWYHESLVRVGQSGGGKSDDLSRYFMTSTDKSRCILSPAVHPLGGPNALKSDAGAVADMEANVPPQNSLCTLFDMVLHPQMLLHLMLKCYSADDYQKIMLEIVRHINTFFKGTLASGSDAQLLLMPCLGQDSMVPINVYRSPPFDNYGSDKSGTLYCKNGGVPSFYNAYKVVLMGRLLQYYSTDDSGESYHTVRRSVDIKDAIVETLSPDDCNAPADAFPFRISFITENSSSSEVMYSTTAEDTESWKVCISSKVHFMQLSAVKLFHCGHMKIGLEESIDKLYVVVDTGVLIIYESSSRSNIADPIAAPYGIGEKRRILLTGASVHVVENNDSNSVSVLNCLHVVLNNTNSSDGVIMQAENIGSRTVWHDQLRAHIEFANKYTSLVEHEDVNAHRKKVMLSKSVSRCEARLENKKLKGKSKSLKNVIWFL